MIDSNSLKWVLIILGLGITTLVVPPLGALGIVGLVILKISQKHLKMQERRQDRSAPTPYWTSDKITETYFR